MTLIEMMTVMVIVAGLFTLAAMGIGALNAADLQRESLQLGAKVRFVYNQSALSNQPYQLVIDLDENSYKVDAIDFSGPLSRDEFTGKAQEHQAENNKQRASRTDREDSKFVALSRSQSDSRLIQATTLPEGLEFIGVQTSHHEELQHEGIATVNFFPSGYVEASLIYVGEQLEDGESHGLDNSYTLIIHPLTGHTSLRSGLVDPDKAFVKP